jgi:peptide-methionine (R)-S-oxide reductase
VAKPTKDELKERLTEEQFRVTQERGTERPFSGAYWDTTESGTYRCICCNEQLFRSETKFDAGCGWPSFYEVFDPEKVEERDDSSHGMKRTEVVCRACGAHLGHVFSDGPKPTGLRYCINSASIDLQTDGDSSEET